jgi:exodeoxyribonuclease X
LLRVIDIETTGIDPATDAIIEIASVDMVRGGGVTNAMDSLVRPNRPIPPAASAVHHIVDEDVKDAPPLAEVIGRFKGADYYVAHNCDFEQRFFAAQRIALGPWICTYKCSLRVWPDLVGHSNQELRYALGRATPFPGFERGSIAPHRAMYDVIVTAAILEELIKAARWADLVQWSREPALHTRFHFGKYRGKRYDEVAHSDPSYLDWIIERSDLEEAIKHSARYWRGVSGAPGAGEPALPLDGEAPRSS